MSLLSSLSICSLLLLTATAAPPQITLNYNHHHGPNAESARQNAPQIFNTIHSSMRQWGSSLNHNGMSFFRATIPANTQFYHGTHTADPVTGTEWLAFEIEHAEVFARSRGPPRKGPRPPGGTPGGGGRGPPPGEGGRDRRPPSPPTGQELEMDVDMSSPADDELNFDVDTRGFLHEYRATRTLDRILYIDGLSAGKTSMGTLDTQDLLLRNDTSSDQPWGEFRRAQELCEMGKSWGMEGILRMEAGFELIYCNFTYGLKFVSATQRPDTSKPEGYNPFGQFEYMRGVAQRYQGITAGRVKLDYSSMVSAFFYPINLTNPNPARSELPRLVSVEAAQLKQMKSDLQVELVKSVSEVHSIIDWQGVADMIITRYSDRLQFMALNTTTQKPLLGELNFLLSVYTNYSSSTPDVAQAIEKCTYHYLKPVSPQTRSDHLIHEAISNVTHRICNTLFEVQSVLLADERVEFDSLQHAKNLIRNLISFLSWSTWLECGKCAYDEVCFVAIWPWGRVEDHENPGCVKKDDTFDRRGYWEFGR